MTCKFTHPSSLLRRIERFFNDNPDEFLTVEDLCTKFDLTKEQAINVLIRLRAEGSDIEVVKCVRRRQ